MNKSVIWIPFAIYFIVFFYSIIPSLLLTIYFIISPFLLVFGSIFIKFLTPSISGKMPTDNQRKKVDDITENIGYKLGVLFKRINEDILDNIPLLIPRKTIIIPIQNKVTIFSTKYIENIVNRYHNRLERFLANRLLESDSHLHKKSLPKIILPLAFLVVLIIEIFVSIYFAILSFMPIMIFFILWFITVKLLIFII